MIPAISKARAIMLSRVRLKSTEPELAISHHPLSAERAGYRLPHEFRPDMVLTQRGSSFFVFRAILPRIVITGAMQLSAWVLAAPDSLRLIERNNILPVLRQHFLA